MLRGIMADSATLHKCAGDRRSELATDQEGWSLLV